MNKAVSAQVKAALEAAGCPPEMIPQVIADARAIEKHKKQVRGLRLKR